MVNKRSILLTIALVLLVSMITLSGGILKSNTTPEGPLALTIPTNETYQPQLVSTHYPSSLKESPLPKTIKKEETNKRNSVSLKRTPKTKTNTLSTQNLASKYIKLASFEPIAKGKKCSNGGYRIDEGYDTNKNEKLDPSEISSTKYVCEDYVAEKLASIDPKKVDFFKVDVRSDLNHNGKIDNNEIVSNK